MTEPSGAHFAAACSTLGNTLPAADEACEKAMAQLGARVDLALVFASFHHHEHFVALADSLHRRLATSCLLGCTGESIVAGDREYENQPALVVWLAHLPGTRLLPMHLDFQANREGGVFSGWHEDLFTDWPASASLLLLGEPFSFPADVLLSRLGSDQPGTAAFGGLASGGWQPGQNRLLLGGRALERGAAAVLIDGPARPRSVVSQGCRPIGRPMVVTKAQQNMIEELGGRPALEQLQAVFSDLSSEDQQLVRQGLHVGRVINEYQEQFGRGDFLIRNVQGFDPERGALAIGDYARVGQTVQFHVRDAQTADEDLTALLSGAQAEAGAPCQGALVFTCNGRGTRLFDAPHHDAGAVARVWPGIPTAGFFAQGEIGPIGGQNFVHGFTASIALFS